MSKSLNFGSASGYGESQGKAFVLILNGLILAFV